MILVYIVCKNKKEARKIGLKLVEKKLVGCCNIFPIESIYRWTPTHPPPSRKRAPERIVKDKEVVLIVKSLKRNFEEIRKEVEKLHSYTIPCILEIPIKRVNSKYLNWLKAELRGKIITTPMFK